ncbi:unnamed protein product [Closterium sp. NIES-54]
MGACPSHLSLPPIVALLSHEDDVLLDGLSLLASISNQIKCLAASHQSRGLAAVTAHEVKVPVPGAAMIRAAGAPVSVAAAAAPPTVPATTPSKFPGRLNEVATAAAPSSKEGGEARAAQAAEGAEGAEEAKEVAPREENMVQGWLEALREGDLLACWLEQMGYDATAVVDLLIQPTTAPSCLRLLLLCLPAAGAMWKHVIGRALWLQCVGSASREVKKQSENGSKRRGNDQLGSERDEWSEGEGEGDETSESEGEERRRGMEEEEGVSAEEECSSEGKEEEGREEEECSSEGEDGEGIQRTCKRQLVGVLEGGTGRRVRKRGLEKVWCGGEDGEEWWHLTDGTRKERKVDGGEDEEDREKEDKDKEYEEDEEEEEEEGIKDDDMKLDGTEHSDFALVTASSDTCSPGGLSHSAVVGSLRCLTQLHTRLSRLQHLGLFPYNVQPLLSRLCEFLDYRH